METIEKTTKSAKAKKTIDWQALAAEAGSYALQGALMTLGAVLVNKGVQSLSPSPVLIDGRENVVPMKKVSNN